MDSNWYTYIGPWRGGRGGGERCPVDFKKNNVAMQADTGFRKEGGGGRVTVRPKYFWVFMSL